MKALRLWEIKIQFSGQDEVRHMVRSEFLRLGRSPKCEYRHELFKNDVEFELQDLASGEEKI